MLQYHFIMVDEFFVYRNTALQVAKGGELWMSVEYDRWNVQKVFHQIFPQVEHLRKHQQHVKRWVFDKIKHGRKKYFLVCSTDKSVCVVDINRSQVLQNIRVRSPLKKDGSWIQRSNDAKKEQDTAGYSQWLRCNFKNWVLKCCFFLLKGVIEAVLSQCHSNLFCVAERTQMWKLNLFQPGVHKSGWQPGDLSKCCKIILKKKKHFWM